jgi:hypothetical protein
MAKDFQISWYVAEMAMNRWRYRMQTSGDESELWLYDGTQPNNADDAITTQNEVANPKISEVTDDIIFGAPLNNGTGAQVTLDPANSTPGNDTVPTGGTTTWFRLEGFGSNGIDGSVGTSGTDLTMLTTTIDADHTVAINNITFVFPFG